MPKVAPAPLTRTLSAVAREILADHREQGKELYFGAVPYVRAMLALDALDDRFGDEKGADIVPYAVSNLSYWRGETARRVKAELNGAMAHYYRGRRR
jgi:hypothetical protein